jgi:hypothetical protein
LAERSADRTTDLTSAACPSVTKRVASGRELDGPNVLRGVDEIPDHDHAAPERGDQADDEGDQATVHATHMLSGVERPGQSVARIASAPVGTGGFDS